MKNSLIIQSKEASLSKEQIAFNKLVKKIEKLRADTEKKTSLLDANMQTYSKEIVVLEKEALDGKITLAKTLYKYYEAKKFKGKDKTSLKGIISNLLQAVMPEAGETDTELQSIFKAIENIDYLDVLDDDFEMQKSMMEEMFTSYGFDIDVNNFRRGMTPEEMMQEAGKMFSELGNQHEEKASKKEKKKTKKQQEKELREQQKEEMRNKNIGQVYKQLAKMFHPDLETDPDKKLEKEELMKQLTIAYENKDLHKLLWLELEYIHKEERDAQNLSTEKLKVYNEVLREQAAGLEDELYQLPLHPQYQPLQKFIDIFDRPNAIFNLNLKAISISLKKALNEMQTDIIGITGPEPIAMKEIRSAISQYNLFKKFNGKERRGRF